MPVETVNTADAISYVGTKQSASSPGLKVDTETFLKLLVAQLQYQDPLNPQTDTQFVSQLAQMTELEQMQGIGASLSSSAAYGMIGKYVYAEVIDSATGIVNQYLGQVSSVALRGGKAYVVIGNTAVAADNVRQVYDERMFAEDPEGGSEEDSGNSAAGA